MAVESAQILCMSVRGRPFTIHANYDTAIAAGVYANLDMNQPASSTSPQDVVVPERCHIVDWLGNADATGVFELISNGRKSGIFVTDSAQGRTNSGRPALQIPLEAGTQLRVQTSTAPTA